MSPPAHPVRSSSDSQTRGTRQISVHPQRLEVLPSDAGELELGSLEGYAAIDPGSTGTRAVIAVVKIDPTTGKRNIVETLRIQDFRQDDDRERRTTRGEWPSKCCPFDGPPYHVGYDADSRHEKRTISIKAIPYFRTQDDDGHPFTKALYDHYNSLPSVTDRQHFNDTLDSILFNFLYDFPTCTFAVHPAGAPIPSSADIREPRSNQVVQRILDKCKRNGVRLRSLGLCVPQTWSRRETPIQEYLGPILDQTVATERIKTTFETTFALEAQCQAQHLISQYPRELKDCNELMTLDFGGHSMVLPPGFRARREFCEANTPENRGGSHSQLHWGSADGRPRFHAPPGSDFGVRGGYELWEIGIGHCIDRIMSRNPKKYLQSRRHVIKSSLLDKFYELKASIDRMKTARLTADLVEYYNDQSAVYTISITAEQVKHEWESAFREPINLASQKIRGVARTGRRLKVLLTGGSANSRNLSSEIQGVCGKLCEQGFAVTCNIVAKELDVVLAPKWSIAEGAACCHATAMNVEEFFDIGAAFAVQTRTATANDGEWASESGELLFCKQNGKERYFKIDIDVDGAKRNFRIIANPFQIVPRERKPINNVVLVRDSYDVWDLLLKYRPSSGGNPVPIPNGRHSLEVAELVCNGREAILVLRMRPNLSVGARRSGRILKKLAIDGVCDWSLLFEVPLTSCGPSNLVELDIDRIRGRYWTLEAETDELDDVATPYCPPAKRRRTDGLSVDIPDSHGR